MAQVIGIVEPECKEIALSYESDNPETIAPDDTASITISGGCPPFTWAVSGTGFSFDEASTTERSNTLNASAAACGAGSITVTDACAESVTGSLRSTTGCWIQHKNYLGGDEQQCYLDGEYTTDLGGGYYDRIVGTVRQKQKEGVACSVGGGPYTCANNYPTCITPGDACQDTDKGCLASGCVKCLSGTPATCPSVDGTAGECCEDIAGGYRIWCVKELSVWLWRCSAECLNGQAINEDNECTSYYYE